MSSKTRCLICLIKPWLLNGSAKGFFTCVECNGAICRECSLKNHEGKSDGDCVGYHYHRECFPSNKLKCSGDEESHYAWRI